MKQIYKNNKDSINSIWISVFIPVFSIGVTYCVSQMEKKIGTSGTILSLLTITFFIASISFLVSMMISSTYNQTILETLDKGTSDLHKTILEKMGIAGIKGIFPESDIAKMESRYNFKEIWLVSHDLLTEINDGVYAGVVKANLKKGVKYKYFVPKTPTNITRVKMFKNNCRNNKKLEFFYLPDSFFFLVPELDFSIYEPFESCLLYTSTSC